MHNILRAALMTAHRTPWFLLGVVISSSVTFACVKSCSQKEEPPKQVEKEKEIIPAAPQAESEPTRTLRVFEISTHETTAEMNNWIREMGGRGYVPEKIERKTKDDINGRATISVYIIIMVKEDQQG